MVGRAVEMDREMRALDPRGIGHRTRGRGAAGVTAAPGRHGLPAPSPAAVVGTAAVHAARLPGLDDAAPADVLGPPAATIPRLASRADALDAGSRSYEPAFLPIRLLQGLDAWAGGEEKPT